MVERWLVSSALTTPPSRELVAARRGLTWRQARAAARAVRKGQRAAEPAVARLAVARARQVIRRSEAVWASVAGTVALLLGAGFFITQVARGHVNASGLIMGAFGVLGLWAAPWLRRYRENSLSAQRLNCDLLDTSSAAARCTPRYSFSWASSWRASRDPPSANRR